jgi:hypothetical protein
VGAPLVECIQRYLDLCLYPTAIFLAERLQAAQPSDEHLQLLATCHLRSGDVKAASALLGSSDSPANR